MSSNELIYGIVSTIVLLLTVVSLVSFAHWLRRNLQGPSKRPTRAASRPARCLSPDPPSGDL